MNLLQLQRKCLYKIATVNITLQLLESHDCLLGSHSLHAEVTTVNLYGSNSALDMLYVPLAYIPVVGCQTKPWKSAIVNMKRNLKQ